MKDLARLLEDLHAGAPIPVELIDAADKDLKAMQALINSIDLDGLVIIDNPVQTAQDDTVHCLGEIYMILQSLVLEMRAKGALELLHGDIAEKIINAKLQLIRYHYEPAKLGKMDALKLRPVTFDRPPEPPQRPEDPQGPPY